MKNSTVVVQVAAMCLLIGVTSCTVQVNNVTPDLEVIGSPSATITPIATHPATSTETPFASTLVVSALTPEQSISTFYASLPTGQYIISAEVSECEQNNAYIACNDLRVMSVDGSISELLVDDLPGEGFTYNNGRVAFTKIVEDPNQQHHQIQVFSFIDGINLEIQNPINKECMAGDWSFDEEQLIVLCRSSDDYRFFEIALLSLKDEEFVTLLQDPNDEDASGGYEQLRLSRDGKWLAFYRLFSKGPELVEGVYIMDMSCLPAPSTCADKTRKLPVEKLVGDTGNRIIDWTPEGYLARALDNRIELHEVQTDQIVRTIIVDSSRGNILEMSWSPDGKWVVIEQSDTLGAFLISTSDEQEIHLTLAIDNPFWMVIP